MKTPLHKDENPANLRISFKQSPFSSSLHKCLRVQHHVRRGLCLPLPAIPVQSLLRDYPESIFELERRQSVEAQALESLLQLMLERFEVPPDTEQEQPK